MHTLECTAQRPLLSALLDSDEQAAAVDRFARWHDAAAEPAQAKYYQDLIPLARPTAGEQYAFEVDLDLCSGCKACVTACHNLNGLEDGELWRNVGLLHGGTSQLPVMQHVTTACHHCLEPACLEGCPVNAYEKDASTGIVHHLDDQCIGCQYCILKCPYDVPKYSKRLGIVRKCDMCSTRLETGEAPACVQACPNRAIRISLVSRQAVVEDSEANLFLPGAPEPGYTQPTTIYKTSKSLPRNLLPADYYSTAPAHAHLPLVCMLVLTQMSVGAFLVDQWLDWTQGGAGVDFLSGGRSVRLVAIFLLGLLGIGASICHLGRPLYAFRAVLGLKTSWLSREIVAFGLYALLAFVYAGLAWMDPSAVEIPLTVHRLLGAAVGLFGTLGVCCSIMIYVSTHRPFWNATFTSVKFVLTAAVLGLPTALAISLAAAASSRHLTVNKIMIDYGVSLCGWLMIAAVAKLLFESAIFTCLRSKQHTPLKRTALLMSGELAPATRKRFLFGLAGGVALPGFLYVTRAHAAAEADGGLVVGILVVLIVAVLLAGELIERYLFFKAATAPKMPGAQAS